MGMQISRPGVPRVGMRTNPSVPAFRNPAEGGGGGMSIKPPAQPVNQAPATGALGRMLGTGGDLVGMGGFNGMGGVTGLPPVGGQPPQGGTMEYDVYRDGPLPGMPLPAGGGMQAGMPSGDTMGKLDHLRDYGSKKAYNGNNFAGAVSGQKHPSIATGGFQGSFPDPGGIAALPSGSTMPLDDKNPLAYLPGPQQQLLPELGRFGLQGLQGLDPRAMVDLPSLPGETAPRATPEGLNPATAGGLAQAGEIGGIQRQGGAGDFVNTQLEQQLFDRGAGNVNQSYDDAVARKMEELRQRGITNFATGSGAAELNRLEDERQNALSNLQTDISTQGMQDAYNNLFRSQQLDLGFGGLGLQGALGAGQLGLGAQGMMQGRESELFGRDMMLGRQPYQDQMAHALQQNALNQQQFGNVTGLAQAALAPGLQAAGQGAANTLAAQQMAQQQAWNNAQLQAQQQAQQSQARGSMFGGIGSLVGGGLGFMAGGPMGGLAGATIGGGLGSIGSLFG